jgi:hypothetical protein
MDVLRDTLRITSRTADASIAAAGAVGGAAVNGVVGGVQGVIGGVGSGLSSGSRSTPAVALTLAAVGVAGLVEWPVLLPIGGTALAVHYLTHRSAGEREPASTRRVGSRSAAKGRSGPRASTTHKAARSRSARSLGGDT